MVASVLDAFGRIDILINNAGVGGNTPFLEIGLEEWNRIISINLTGAFLVAQACAREMVIVHPLRTLGFLQWVDSKDHRDGFMPIGTLSLGVQQP